MIAFDRSRRAEPQPASRNAAQRVAGDDRDGSPRVRQLRQLQRQLNASPGVMAQMQLAEDLNAAQRRKFSSDDALRQKQQEATLRSPSSDPTQPVVDEGNPRLAAVKAPIRGQRTAGRIAAPIETGRDDQQAEGGRRFGRALSGIASDAAPLWYGR